MGEQELLSERLAERALEPLSEPASLVTSLGSVRRSSMLPAVRQKANSSRWSLTRRWSLTPENPPTEVLLRAVYPAKTWCW